MREPHENSRFDNTLIKRPDLFTYLCEDTNLARRSKEKLAKCFSITSLHVFSSDSWRSKYDRSSCVLLSVEGLTRLLLLLERSSLSSSRCRFGGTSGLLAIGPLDVTGLTFSDFDLKKDVIIVTEELLSNDRGNRSIRCQCTVV
jgi:hypothetical protein